MLVPLVLALCGCGPSAGERQAATDLAYVKTRLHELESEQKRTSAALDSAAKELAASKKRADEGQQQLEVAISKLTASEARVAELQGMVAATTKERIALEEKLRGLQAAETKRAEEQASAEAERRSRATVTLQVGLQFRSGDSRPVSNTDFFLSAVSMASLLAKHYHAAAGHDAYFDMVLAAHYGLDDEKLVGYQKVMASLTASAVAKTRTDFAGKATLSSISPGKYYLIGVTPMGKSGAIWDLGITLTSGENQIYLDQDNARAAY